jgi:two-component system, OmpR family, KDP operon response regulator KdpE
VSPENAEHKPLVLIIEDEAPIRAFLRAALTGHGYRVEEAERGDMGLIHAATFVPDLVILDLGLPDTDGLTVTKRLREWSAVPILVLSARGQEKDKVAALDAGADDYLTKPFSMPELLARLRVALRHASQRQRGDEGAAIEVGGLRIDLAARRVSLDGADVRLTNLEYRLLAHLARHAGKVLTQHQILQDVWGPGSAGQAHTLRVFMSQLRHKLEADPARPRYLLTEQGVGYRLAGE